VSVLDEVLAFVKVVASSLGEQEPVTLYNVIGASGMTEDGADDADDAGEQGHEQEVFQSLGIVARPRPPAGDAFTEALSARTADGLIPFAYRDRRLHQRFPAPHEGTIALVGYGGAFLSFDDTAANSGDDKATEAVLYVPFNWSGGVPAKAHTIMVSPTEGLALVHADGAALCLTDEAAILKSPDGTAFIEVRDGKIILNAPKIVCRGGILVGDESAPAFPI